MAEDKNAVWEGICGLVLGSPERWLGKTARAVLASVLYSGKKKNIVIFVDEVHTTYKWYVQ